MLNKMNETTNAVNDLLNEAPKSTASKFDKAIYDIADMTDRNDHTGALIAGAEFLGAKKLKRIFAAIDIIRVMEGSLHPTIGKYRSEKSEQLMKLAKKELDPEQFKKFNGAY